MEDRRELGLQKSVDLERGLFIVRYSVAEDEAFPPKVTIVSAPGSDTVLPILHPDAQEPVLWQPGSAMVVQVLEPGQLLVEVTPTRPRGSAAATIKIETLGQGKPTLDITLRESDRAGAAPALAKPGTSDFRVLGHVAGRGDVFVGANEWIGGPAAPVRIEGLAIEWPNRPAGLSIRYAVMTAMPDAVSNAPADIGTFLGTRGRALPLLGVMFELTGPSSAGYELVVEAAFLGAPINSTRGSKLTLTGPSGREPLVGVRLSVEPVSAAAQPKSEPNRPAQPNQPAARVRVFRSTGKS